MKIVIRDNIGYVAYSVNEEYGIEFCDGFFYWTDTDYEDHKTPISNLVRIVTPVTMPYEN